ncbi:hypothetical protein KCP73_17460 [Salmonella enterica subsp. enterica]|nr:hypothetical protein KCP73_17460 [Salmonella enterica subsp. enterica]
MHNATAVSAGGADRKVPHAGLSRPQCAASFHLPMRSARRRVTPYAAPTPGHSLAVVAITLSYAHKPAAASTRWWSMSIND